jgi:hypothetical protein
MAFRLSVTGAAAWAVVGGVSRAAIAAVHITDSSGDLRQLVLIAAAIGVVIGALAGATGRPLLGTAVGAALAGVVFIVTLSAVWMFALIGAGTLPSLLEILAAGALAGGIGGAVGRKWPWDANERRRKP